jgi:UDP-N-acetylglucosamine--N-acetylmuramyl-(pentapeptide) pyrophosphoryl-undecaprenol N-acetylglucosamine transferase
MWKMFFGFWQSLFFMIFWRPRIVFLKGGYVGVPVGLAARLLRIPIIIHESDAGSLGLANRILARFACTVFTGAPIENYKVSAKIKNKMKWVGVPISDKFASIRQRILAGDEMDIPASISEEFMEFDKLTKGKDQIVLVMGGSLGARRINEDVLLNIDKLRKGAFLVLVSGVGQNYDDAMKLAEGQSNVTILPFSDHLPEIMSVSQIIVARAGATTIAEIEALMKPAVLVPNAKLPGSHQTKNARILASQGACICIEDYIDEKPLSIIESVNSLLDNPKKQKQMSEALGNLAKVDATKVIVQALMGDN